MKTQETINATATILKERLINHHQVTTWKRFNKKACWVSNCINNRYFLVKSYDTIVAIIDDQQGELFELGKWSCTTSKQITQLFNLPDVISYNTFGYSKLLARYLVK